MRVRWESADPETATARLGAILGLTAEAVAGRHEFALLNTVVEVGPLQAGAIRSDDRLRLIEVSMAPPGHPTRTPGLVLQAVGIATVDIERFTADQDLLLRPLPPDPFLGATCVAVATGPILLEPNTEGRIASTLARFGEGPAALFLGVEDADALDGVRTAIRQRGLPVTAVTAGPLGPEFAIAIGPAWGPHILICASAGPSAGTIDP